MANDNIKRLDCEKAHSFTAGVCGDPGCGLHIVALRANDQPICELIIGRAAIRGLLELIDDQGLDL